MINKILLSVLLAFFVAACAITPKDTADTSSSGSSSSSDTVSSSDSSSEEGVITETAGTAIVPGSQEDLIVNVGDRVFFNYDSSELDADAQELLQHQAAWMKQYNINNIIIQGHCDERGTREYNLALGERRAQAVKNYLSGLGILPDISTISYGKERPAVLGSHEGAWSQNRRSVTIVN